MIKVSHLTKYYGDTLAVDDLSFEIGQGHVYGFLGPNGAGKSTTMNIITGCLSPTEGQVSVAGHDILEEPLEARKCIGYLPEQPPLYLNETPEEYLRFVGQARGLRGQELREQIETAMDQTGILSVRTRRIGALSKGYKQRVGIAQALLGDPKVIILDEPTAGLDPLQIIEIRQLIRELGKTHTVIFSSHILSEVQTICDRILIIARGRLVAFDEPDNLEHKLRASGEITLTTDAASADARALLAKVPQAAVLSETSLKEGLLSIKLSSDAEDIYTVSRAVFHAFAGSSWAILEMSLKKADLEDVFIELAGSSQEAEAEESDEDVEDEEE